VSDVGVELGARALRAVAVGRLTGRVRAAVEVPWDPERPDDAVARLAASIGGARRVGLAVGLAFLHVARASLPPLRAADRRRALALEPDRHFAAPADGVVVALAGEAPPAPGAAEPAFAADRALVERWVEAFGRWAPVECVEPAPTSVARALAPGSWPGAGGAPLADATFALPAGDGETGLLTLEGGRVVAVRRAPAAPAGTRASAPAAPAAPAARALPAHRGATGEQLAALGAALGVDEAPDAMLLPASISDAVRARRRRRLVVAAAACAAAAALLAVAADRSRAAYLDRVDRALAAAERAAEPGAALRARLAALDAAARESDALGARRADPLGVLAALGERLPADVTVLALQMDGDEWQLDGAARDAAAVVPLLDGDPRFTDVRALAPSSRYEAGGSGRRRETFSVAFRVRDAAASAAPAAPAARTDGGGGR
jgi:hypothetical protein